MKELKAILLLSGGLDSILAGRVMMGQGVDIEALNFVTAFCTCTPKSAGCSAAAAAGRELGIPVRTLNATEEMLALLPDPPHGFGRYLNPCIDCRISMFRRARERMEEWGASFLVTGEVLGERPMSQRRQAMMEIERHAGVEGYVVRPLSARLMEPSLPEKEGVIDREKLLAIQGRSRKPQIALAEEFGIRDYPCPAGGCRLTDGGYAGRMKDLLDYQRNITPRDAILLRYGRHFRLSRAEKCIVGRNEEENATLHRLAEPGDVLAVPDALPGPSVLLPGEAGEEAPRRACSLAASYMKLSGPVMFNALKGGVSHGIEALPAPQTEVDNLLVRPLRPGWRTRAPAAALPGA